MKLWLLIWLANFGYTLNETVVVNVASKFASHACRFKMDSVLFRCAYMYTPAMNGSFCFVTGSIIDSLYRQGAADRWKVYPRNRRRCSS